MLQENNYEVSIRLMVYNQEEFIRETMESIFNQVVDFKVEIVVGDDFSSDKTLEIIRSFRSTDKIHLRILERREGDDYWQKRKLQGRLYNFRNIISNCNGKYIAILDGDDFWTDPFKLQKQYDLLEADASLSLACHNLTTLYTETGKTFQRFNDRYKPASRITLNEMLGANWASTPTIMIRSEIIKTAPDWIFSERVADYFLWCYASTFGDIGYLHEPMAVYRVHNKGVWGRDSAKKRAVNEVENIIRANRRFCNNEKLLQSRIADLKIRLIRNLEQEGFKADSFIKRIGFALSYLGKGQLKQSGRFLLS
jgi:glycosyltransferase involved in cell wall biosynthesis